jgi:hypothetical protein
MEAAPKMTTSKNLLIEDVALFCWGLMRLSLAEGLWALAFAFAVIV